MKTYQKVSKKIKSKLKLIDLPPFYIVYVILSKKNTKGSFSKWKKSKLTISNLRLPTHHLAHHVIIYEPIRMLGMSSELNQTFYYSELRFEYSYHREGW